VVMPIGTGFQVTGLQSLVRFSVKRVVSAGDRGFSSVFGHIREAGSRSTQVQTGLRGKFGHILGTFSLVEKTTLENHSRPPSGNDLGQSMPSLLYRNQGMDSASVIRMPTLPGPDPVGGGNPPGRAW
jgi:hypothetical protein